MKNGPPRIVLDPVLAAYVLKKGADKPSDGSYSAFNELRNDPCDGLWFIDYLKPVGTRSEDDAEELRTARKAICEWIKSQKEIHQADHRVRSKYHWLEQYEAATHHHRIIECIKKGGVKAGISLNPGTPVSVLEEILGFVDLVLLMSVNPGFGGQVFIEKTYEKLERLYELAQKTGNTDFLTQVDGGIDPEIALKLKKQGVDICVIGSYITGSTDPKSKLQEFIEKLGTGG